MTAQVSSQPSLGRGSSWTGRASSIRREQVRSRGHEPVTQGPTGPVQSPRGPVVRGTRGEVLDAGTVEELCAPVVQMLLRELEGLSSVLVCTADGAPLAAFGLSDADVSSVARRSRAMFKAGGGRGTAAAREDGAKVVNVTSGQTHTVITAVSTPELGEHLLSVVAEGTSPGVMLLRTRQAADDLRKILAASLCA